MEAHTPPCECEARHSLCTSRSHRGPPPPRFADPGASDRQFAENVGKERGAVLCFLTPEAAFGPAAGAVKGTTAVDVAATPASALAARWSLMGGYLAGPIVLMLCGAQGSGKVQPPATT